MAGARLTIIAPVIPGQPATRQLTHVALLVRDYDDAIAWFTQRLGFRLVQDTPVAAGKRWVVVAPAADGGGCSLLLARAATPAQEIAVGRQSGPGGAAHGDRVGVAHHGGERARPGR